MSGKKPVNFSDTAFFVGSMFSILHNIGKIFRDIWALFEVINTIILINE